MTYNVFSGTLNRTQSILDTVGWVTGRASSLKNLCHLSQKKVAEENPGWTG